MARILFLSHRLPFPPDKGDKIHSHHVLRHLAQRHQVALGTFIDDPQDEAHIAQARALCAQVHVARLPPWRGRMRALSGLLRSRAVTLSHFGDAGLAAWVEDIRRRGEVDLVFVYSAAMAPYAVDFRVPVWIDFADVDSAKWDRFARRASGPMAWLYAREARLLLAHERAAAARAQRCFFVTEREAALFRSLAPEVASRIAVLPNGVDQDFFRLDPARPSPYAAEEQAIVFTGKMDYWPNVDAVRWFATQVLPGLRQRWPRLRLHVVGRHPSAAVRALQGPAVSVTGAVADVRPFLQHASVAVAPMRLVNGVQNKVLEAMAMQRAVVTAPECAEAIGAIPGVDLLVARDAAEYAQAIERLLQEPAFGVRLGAAARECMRRRHDWTQCLQVLDSEWQAAEARRAASVGAAGPVPQAHPAVEALS